MTAAGDASAPARARRVHPIEVESYRILRSRVDLGHLPPWTRAVVERVVHASADLGYVDDLRCEEESLARAAGLLAQGVPVVVDAQMVATGITAYPTCCLVGGTRAREVAEGEGLTRSAAAMRVAADEVPPGAVWVVGNAPTALFEVLDLADRIAPALVVGLPVGFVGAVESKRALRESGLPHVTNRSEKGGSAVAAAALNALLYGSPL